LFTTGVQVENFFPGIAAPSQSWGRACEAPGTQIERLEHRAIAAVASDGISERNRE
jgi:hypothetical protein